MTLYLKDRGSGLNSKLKWHVGRIALLAVIVITVGVSAFGCISGISAIGWSGGTVSDRTMYVGSREGRLVAVNLTDDSRQWSEQLKMVAQTGLFGCGPGAGGCGTASTAVAIYGSPVVSGGLVYIAGYNGKIYAYNSSNINQVRWVYPREGNLKPFIGGLVADQGRLYVGCADGKVYALDAATGDKLWEFDTGDKIWATPAYYGNTIYNGSLNQTIKNDMLFIGSFDNKLYALNPADGSKKWEFAAEGAIIATPLMFDSTVYIGSLDRNLYALRAADGSVKWKFTAKNWFWAEPAVWNGNIYAGCLDGYVYVLKADTGEKVAALNLKSPIASNPVVVDNSVIFATRKGVIYSVNTSTNQATQLADIKSEIDGPLTAVAGIIYVQTRDIALQRINAANGSVLSPISLKGQ